MQYDGFREVTIRAHVRGRHVVIPVQEGLPLPCHTVPGDHDCDAMGCGWEHVMARFDLPREAGPDGHPAPPEE